MNALDVFTFNNSENKEMWNYEYKENPWEIRNKLLNSQYEKGQALNNEDEYSLNFNDFQLIS